MTTTGTGMMAKNGDILFTFPNHQLEDLVNRQRILLVALVLGSLYLLLAAFIGFSLPSDLLMIAGTAFIAYRSQKVREEIAELKQYLHGEEVPALT